MKKSYLGKWSIEEMEIWNKDFIDLVVPGYISIAKGNDCHFQFGVVEADMDCHIEESGDGERLEFSWEGFDEGDSVSGRGWAVLDEEKLVGRIYFHMGDNSSFMAIRGQ